MNNDGKIGLEEAVFVLAQIAEPQKGRAVLGPLSGAEVRAYRLKDMKTPVYTTTTDADGYFDSFVTGINQSEYILVSVSGGEDTDADDDGEPDASPTPNAGTIHALMTVSEFNAGGFNVSALTDIAWQFTKNLVGQVENSDLGSRLNALAGTFIAEDLSGDDTTDAADFLKFNPSDDQHKEKLNFDFQHFFTENADGHSIIDCFHEDLTDVLPVLLDEKFGSRLLRTSGFPLVPENETVDELELVNHLHNPLIQAFGHEPRGIPCHVPQIVCVPAFVREAGVLYENEQMVQPLLPGGLCGR